MKNFLLILGFSILSISVFAEGVPAVQVHKSQGGWTAIINMYNYVTYTPAEISDNGIAQLNCTGHGFSFCRVPNCTTVPVNNNAVVSNITDQARVNMFVNAINEVLENIENQTSSNNSVTNGTDARRNPVVSRTYNKKIAIQNASAHERSKNKLYEVKAIQRQDTRDGSENIDIYINGVDVQF